MSYIPHVMLVFVILLALTLIFSSRLSFSTIMFCLICIGIIYCLFKLMIKNCQEFVNYPVGTIPVRLWYLHWFYT